MLALLMFRSTDFAWRKADESCVRRLRMVVRPIASGKASNPDRTREGGTREGGAREGEAREGETRDEPGCDGFNVAEPAAS
jgi:hypothetical protein